MPNCDCPYANEVEYLRCIHCEENPEPNFPQVYPAEEGMGMVFVLLTAESNAVALDREDAELLLKRLKAEVEVIAQDYEVCTSDV